MADWNDAIEAAAKVASEATVSLADYNQTGRYEFATLNMARLRTSIAGTIRSLKRPDAHLASVPDIECHCDTCGHTGLNWPFVNGVRPCPECGGLSIKENPAGKWPDSVPDRDAERYKWIRAHSYADIAACWLVDVQEPYSPESLDTAIDAAIAAAQQEGKP